jgi:flagellar hook-associated protein 1 FlgK
MPGLFSGLEIGKKSLATQQLWLNTIGHNIANVNTPGYTRQRVMIRSADPEEHRVGLMGAGVLATDIRSVRDLFLNQQFRMERKNLGQWAAMERTMTQIDAVFKEPYADSLGDLMNDFWNSWSDLANPGNTEPAAARNAVKEKAVMMCEGFNRVYEYMHDMRVSVNEEIELIVDKVNTMTSEIAALNMKISREELVGRGANDHRDRRDYLIDQLSQYIDVNTITRKSGAVVVQVGAMTIVDEVAATPLSTVAKTNKGVAISEITWENSSKPVQNLKGELKGLTDTRDQVIPDYLDKLDELVKTLVNEVNTRHRIGYGLNGTTGVEFFESSFSSAGKISVSYDILNDVSKIAASLSGEVGDNTNALEIADIRNSLIMSEGNSTMGQFYNAIISQIGVDGDKATQFRKDHELLVEQIENARQSVQGVSLDEEMAQMIKYQHAFDAAARVITTIDEALEQVIMRMGIVGR